MSIYKERRKVGETDEGRNGGRKDGKERERSSVGKCPVLRRLDICVHLREIRKHSSVMGSGRHI